MASTISLVYNESFLLCTIIGHLVFLLGILPRQNVRDAVRMVPYCTIALQIAFLVDNSLSGITVQGQGAICVTKIAQEFWIAEHVNS